MAKQVWKGDSDENTSKQEKEGTVMRINESVLGWHTCKVKWTVARNRTPSNEKSKSMSQEMFIVRTSSRL